MLPRLFAAGAVRTVLLCAVAVGVVLAARPSSQGSASAYQIYTSDGQRPLPFRASGNVDYVTLDQLAAIFNLTLTEDTLVGGMTVRGQGQSILLIPGQSFASIGPGRVVSLPAPVQRDRAAWQVPIDFIRLALGPVMNLRVEIRRATHTILIGDVRLPQVTVRFERQGSGVRLTVDVQPPTPSRVVREGNRLVIRFDAVALDLAPVTGLVQEFATAVRATGPMLAVELGQATASYRLVDSDDDRLVAELMPQAAVPAVPGPPPSGPATGGPRPPAPELPIADGLPPGSLRTIVIDPGHGGPDAGVRGAGGTNEKDYVLDIARRLKATIESRIGLRVLLTRETDEDVTLDRRTSFANNNKADLFISLHANASVDPEAAGAQILSLNLDDYARRGAATTPQDLPVPVAGGGSRSIDVVPWDLAQIPFAAKSATLSAILARHFGEHGIPLYTPALLRLPLRTLVGANMPAILVEMGFLSSRQEERVLGSSERSADTIDAIVATINEVRRGIPAATAPVGTR